MMPRVSEQFAEYTEDYKQDYEHSTDTNPIALQDNESFTYDNEYETMTSNAPTKTHKVQNYL